MTIVPHKSQAKPIKSPHRPGTHVQSTEHVTVHPSVAAGKPVSPFPCSVVADYDNDSLIRFLVENYISEDEISNMPFECSSVKFKSQICGAWVEVLPVLCARKEQSRTLMLAMRALALSIVEKGSSKECLKNSEYTNTYCLALESLRNGISRSKCNILYAEFAAASMCLTLSEVMHPTSEHGWESHVKGVGELMQHQGPEAHMDGIAHKLFIGFRPLLLAVAIQSLEPSFLAHWDWLTLPFTIHSPSAMQELLSCVASLPKLLLAARSFQENPSDVRQVGVNDLKLWKAFDEILTSLDDWEKSLLANFDGNLYWVMSHHTRGTPNTSHRNGGIPQSLWFPNVWVANCMIYFWAFQIMASTEMKKVEESNPIILCKIRKTKDVVLLSTQICQSMEYLMQDSMRLYGPASTFLPLATAKAVFMTAEVDCTDYRNWCQQIGQQLVAKGLLITAYQMDLPTAP